MSGKTSEKLILAITEMIKRNDCEVEEIRCKKLVSQSSKEINTTAEDEKATKSDLDLKKCKYFDKGYFKYGYECR